VTPPEITVFDHYGIESGMLEKLQAFSEKAIDGVLRLPAGSLPSQLIAMAEVEVSLVSDAAIGAAHQEFMSIAGATDVITFQHGELLVSVDTAERQAAEYGQATERELALYIAHGLLHLHGHDDHVPGEAKTMELLQENLVMENWENGETS